MQKISKLINSDDQINEIINSLLFSFFKKISKGGLKSGVSAVFPGLDIDRFILNKIKKLFYINKKINLGKNIGDAYVSYCDGIKIYSTGILGFFIKNIFIPEEKIFVIISDIFNQIQEKYFTDEKYIKHKVDAILKKLSQTNICINTKLEEKTLYDVILLMILNYYDIVGSKSSIAFKNTLNKIDKKEIAISFINFITENLSIIFESLSKNIYFDYKFIFDSSFLRFFLNRKTNNGQISKLLSVFNFDINRILNKTVKDYASASFLQSFGELIIDMTGVISDFYENDGLNDSINLTICFGSILGSRIFRWFNNYKFRKKNDKFIKDFEEEFLEISEDKNFYFFRRIKPKKDIVVLSRPVINFGFIAKYEIEYRVCFTAEVIGLEQNKIYYYRIKSKSRKYVNNFKINENFKLNIKNDIKDLNNIRNNFSFLVFSDSQGMTRSDYKIFLNLLDISIENCSDVDFLVHLGDFVDDGNNENYWDFILNSPIWGKFAIFPVCGNHEAKFNPSMNYFGVENSLINHFAIKKLCLINSEDQKDFSKGMYYSYIYNNVLFLVLNTNLEDDAQSLERKQYMWASNVLKNTNARFKIILTHKSAFSNSQHSRDKDIEFISSDIMTLCALNRVDLVIGGHDHVYSRSALTLMGKSIKLDDFQNETIDGFKIINNSFDGIYSEGTIFVTCGASGVKNYKICENPLNKNDVVLNFEFPSYIQIEITNEDIKLDAKFFDKKSNKVFSADKFLIRKNIKKIEKEEEKKVDILDIYNKKAEMMIACLPDCPWLMWDERIEKINKVLSKINNPDIKNMFKFIKFKKDNEILSKIMSASIYIVFDKNTFLAAISNRKFGQIIVKCNEMKFGNFFGCGVNIHVNHSICIRGKCEFYGVKFIIKKNVTFIIEGEIIINSSCSISSFNKNSAFKMQKNTTLILGRQVSVLQSIPISNENENIRVYNKSNN